MRPPIFGENDEEVFAHENVVGAVIGPWQENTNGYR